MDLEVVLHMKSGDGQLSYANNSQVQKQAVSGGGQILADAVEEYYDAVSKSPDVFVVAELGCSSGKNALSAVTDIVTLVGAQCRRLSYRLPAIQVFLNDLPGNDFNTLFRSLPPRWEGEGEDEISCFVAGMAASFYGRLFPDRSVHLFHSSYSIHYLSQIPPEFLKDDRPVVNKGNIYLSPTSPRGAVDAYRNQFRRDFSRFLGLRAVETVPGGRMVLFFSGRRDEDPASKEQHEWYLLAESLSGLVNEGRIQEEELDSFNIPLYFASTTEVELEVRREGSFVIKHLEIVRTEVSGIEPEGNKGEGNAGTNDPFSQCEKTNGAIVSRALRAVLEPIITAQFNEEIIEDLFQRYKEKLDQHYQENFAEYFTLYLSLERKLELGIN